MIATIRILFVGSIVLGGCLVSAPRSLAAQSTAEKVGSAVTRGAKTTKHNVVKISRKVGHKTKSAAKSTYRATANLVVGHRILCGDGTWASRDNPTCSDHGGVAARQPADKDKHQP
ncbi:MAG: hypothetical protein ABJB49_09830 [Nitrospirota bacterium]